MRKNRNTKPANPRISDAKKSYPNVSRVLGWPVNATTTSGIPSRTIFNRRKSDERGAASFYNLARVGVGEDQIRPETDHEHGWSKNAQIQKHLPPLADFTLEEITVKHFVEMRRGKTERGGTCKIEAAVVILSALS